MIEAVTVQVVSETPWWSLWLQLLAPLVAIGIAVGSALRDNHRRREDVKAQLRRETAAEDLRALHEAQRVVFEYGQSSESALWTFTNAGPGPIMDLTILGGTGPLPDGSTAKWHIDMTATRFKRLLPPGKSVTFGGFWTNSKGEQLPRDERQSGAFPIAIWTDGAQRYWRLDHPGRSVTRTDTPNGNALPIE